MKAVKLSFPISPYLHFIKYISLDITKPTILITHDPEGGTSIQLFKLFFSHGGLNYAIKEKEIKTQ